MPYKTQAVNDALDALGDFSSVSSKVRNYEIQDWIRSNRNGMEVEKRTIEKAVALRKSQSSF